MINETINNIANLTLKETHKLIAEPTIIISTISSLIIFLIIGLIGVDGGKSRVRFLIIWFISLIFILAISVWLINSPNLVQNIANWFK